jgi:hypothetical protein
MTGITQAVNALAEQLGVTVDWQALHNNLNAHPVPALITTASTYMFNASLLEHHQQLINESLDLSAGQAGLSQDQQDIVATLAKVSLKLLDEQQAAIENARELLGPLHKLGVVGPST